jgi:hypothetical protein
MLTKSMLFLAVLGLTSTAHAQTPYITGVSAFWYLGSGINSDGGYYAQAQLTANPNGASGAITWRVATTGAGTVTLDCTSGCSVVNRDGDPR